jgi:hypothetical protein
MGAGIESGEESAILTTYAFKQKGAVVRCLEYAVKLRF